MRPDFLAELQRRNVLRAAAFYAAAAWLLVQVATQVFPFFNIPNSVVRLVVVAAIAGFPLALVFAWFYELTPQGIKRESQFDRSHPRVRAARKRFDRWIIVALGLAVVLLLVDRLMPRSAVDAPVAGQSIAVLPFENLSADQSNAYFADGIQDEILTRLAKIGALKVISRTSTQQYASKPGSLPEIARQLGVATVLEGSVQKVGNAVRVTVQLIKAATDKHLWAETYDRRLDDIFGVETEVAQANASELQVKLSGGEVTAVAARSTANAAAYDAYLRARAIETHEASPSIDVLRNELALFGEAVRLDPGFALAGARIAIVKSFMYANFFDRSPTQLDEVKQAAETALRLQPELGEAYLALVRSKSSLRCTAPTPTTSISPRDTRSRMRLDDEKQAMMWARRGVELNAGDAFLRPRSATLAQVEAEFGHVDEVVAMLPHLLEVPNGETRASLRLHPVWDALRKDPAFLKLIVAEATSGRPNDNTH